MLKTIRSVVRLRKFEFNGTKRRLAKVGNVDDLRALETHERLRTKTRMTFTP